MNDPIEELNRSAKLFVDSGAAATVEDAMERLQAFRLHIVVGERASQSPTHQAALFTALNCGRRTFLGGVTVSGALGARLAVSVMPTGSLADAVVHFRGQIVEEAPPGVPVIAIGTTFDAGASFAVRATFDGWRGGVVPGLAEPLCEASEFALSGVLAGALGVAEAFAHLNGEAMAGSRSVGMSLWDLAPGDWRSQEADGPPPEVLPADFWLIGLGHLGQAFLWAIGLLPYPDPSAVRVFLQDVDTVGVSTESTSVLSTVYHRGEMKTRVCGEWASARGFEVRMVERRFGADLRVAPDEPALALCG
ncbi:thiamine biosynthesis protein ThiF, partial [Acidisphaera sp. L21]|uniref:thiamine biosynthesis protein ThiF n=1 Tax=Acidisphaera sp. L21 TaxID=1641851 RepID=UPI00131E1CD2